MADKWPNSGVPTTPGQSGANTGCTSSAEQRPCGGGNVLTIRLNTGFKPVSTHTAPLRKRSRAGRRLRSELNLLRILLVQI